MSLYKDKTDSYCVAGRHRSNINADITAKGSKILICPC